MKMYQFWAKSTYFYPKNGSSKKLQMYQMYRYIFSQGAWAIPNVQMYGEGSPPLIP